MKVFISIVVVFIIASVSYFFWEMSSTINALGPVDPSSINSGNIFIQIWGKNNGGNVWVGCVIKPDSNGIWYILGGGHQNVGCTGVSQDDSGVTVSFANYDKIITSSIDVDETLSVDGYSAGASVGYSSAYIQIGN